MTDERTKIENDIKKVDAEIDELVYKITKTKYESEKQVLTLASCWLFEKRSFAVSGDFHDFVYAMISKKKF